MPIQTNPNPIIVPPRPGQDGRPSGDDPYKPIEMSFFDQVVSFFGRFFGGVVELVKKAAEAAKEIIEELPQITRDASKALPFAAAIALIVIAERAQS